MNWTTDRRRSEPCACARGFTLVELAAVIVVVCVAGSLLLPAIARSRQRSAQARCKSNLRQIGLALQLYVTTNEGKLPGPIAPEVRSIYDDASRNELAWFIAEDLGFPKTSTNSITVGVLVCPACERSTQEDGCPVAEISYVLNDDVDRKKGSRVFPFGSLKDHLATPLTLAEVSQYGSPASTFAVSDADKGNVNPKAPCWKQLPYVPTHGQERNQLMFDWHVESKRW